MICPNCKQETSNDSKFCEKCGHKIENPTAAPEPQQYTPGQQVNFAQPEPQQYMPGQQTVPLQPEPQQFTPGQQVNPVQPAPKKPLNKKLLFGLIGGAAALVVIIIVVAVILLNSKSTINLNDYVTVEFSGYDGYGEADIYFDTSTLYEDISDKGKGVSKYSDDISSLSSLYSYLTDDGLNDYYNMLDSIDYSLDKSDSLSNGDTVTVSFTFDNDYAKKFKLKFVGNDMSFNVSGLDELDEIDPFEGVYLSFSGTSPNAYASIECSSSDNEFYNQLEYYYNLSKSSGIAKGDTITVSIDEDDDEYFVEYYGLKLTSFSKDFVCEELDSYVESLDAIDDDLLESMKGQTEDVIEDYFADEASYIKYKGLKYEGCYFLTAKSSDTWSSKNICYVIYSASVSSVADDDGKTDFDTTKVYLPVKFTDIVEYSDGSQYVDLSDGHSISGTTSLDYSWFSHVSGYTKKATMYSELISAEKSNYNAEFTDGLDK